VQIHSPLFTPTAIPDSVLKARYRAEHRNVANATVSNIGDGGEARVAYEDGNEEDLTERDLRDLLEAYGKELFKEIINGILPAFDYLENRLTGNSKYMFKCGLSFLICELVQLFKPSYISEKKNIDLVRGLSNSSRWREAGPHGAIAARPAHLHGCCYGFSIDHGEGRLH
jgi:hypothetical protein